MARHIEKKRFAFLLMNLDNLLESDIMTLLLV